jgi:hypothetical protein
MQGTCREHAGNMQGTCREHAGNMQGTSREHAGNMQGTCREHACVHSPVLPLLNGGVQVEASPWRHKVGTANPAKYLTGRVEKREGGVEKGEEVWAIERLALQTQLSI